MTESRLPLGQAFGTPDAKRRYTRRLFATIADRYDLITRVLSFGRDQAWKADLIDRAAAGPGTRVLDLACGTGDLAFLAAARDAWVVQSAGRDPVWSPWHRAGLRPVAPLFDDCP